MASSDDKSDTDARRMGSRNFGGYLLDRATGRADFKKSASPGGSASASPLGVNKTRRQGVTDEAYAAGGRVGTTPSQASIRSYSKEYDTISPAGKNVHEAGAGRRYAAGGIVSTKQSRGFGKARRGA